LLITIIIFLIFLTCENVVSADESLYLKINAGWNPDYAPVFRALTELGSSTLWFIAVFVLWIFGKRTLATYLLVAILIHIAIGGSLKYIIDRPRPFNLFPNAFSLYSPTDPSFPSGHTEGSFAAALVLGLRNKKLLVPLSLLAAFVGMSRVYIGVHFPLDVISGAIFGVLIGALAASLDVSRLQNRMESGWKRILDFLKGRPRKQP
jgi:undecaprenyl-diphosphatase